MMRDDEPDDIDVEEWPEWVDHGSPVGLLDSVADWFVTAVLRIEDEACCGAKSLTTERRAYVHGR